MPDNIIFLIPSYGTGGQTNGNCVFRKGLKTDNWFLIPDLPVNPLRLDFKRY